MRTAIDTNMFAGYASHVGLVKRVCASNWQPWGGLLVDCYVLDLPGYPIIEKCLVPSRAGSSEESAVIYRPQETDWDPAQDSSPDKAEKGDFVIISFLLDGTPYISHYLPRPAQNGVSLGLQVLAGCQPVQSAGGNTDAQETRPAAQPGRHRIYPRFEQIAWKVPDQVLASDTHLNMDTLPEKVVAMANMKPTETTVPGGMGMVDTETTVDSGEKPPKEDAEKTPPEKKRQTTEADPAETAQPDLTTQEVTHFAKNLQIVRQNSGKIIIDASQGDVMLQVTLGKNSKLKIVFGGGSVTFGSSEVKLDANSLSLKANQIKLEDAAGGKITLSNGMATISGTSAALDAPNVSLGKPAIAPVMVQSPTGAPVPSGTMKGSA